jgi:uncharacterized protein YjiK
MIAAKIAPMLKTFSAAFALALVACVDPSPAAQPRSPPPAPGESLFVPEISAQAILPNRLREISGMALTADGRLFAHNDERGAIYELNADTGAPIKSFALGEAMGDFEGLAITPAGIFWIVTSQGQVLSFREGADGETVQYETFDTGLGAACEIEGLAYLAAEDSLIVACKQNNAREQRDRVSLYLWSAERGARAWLDLSEADIAGAAGERQFRPSSVEVDPATGRILVLSARDAVLAELTSEGALVTARELEGQHRQPESMVVLPNGAILIADEAGDRDGTAKLTRYDRAL